MKARCPLLVSLLLMSSVLLLWLPDRAACQKTQELGLVEDVVLLPWGIRLPARIDTGAALTSLDARDLVVRDNVAEFRLPEKYGGQTLRLPVVGWRTVKSAEAKERRPVVELDVCIGSKRLLVKANLNDRSKVKYPMLIGRDVLRHGFAVNCMRSHCLMPNCPELGQQ
jgi:hypothetical protein